MELTACCACMQALSCKPPFSNYKDSPNISKGNYLLHCPWIRGPNIYSGLLKGSIKLRMGVQLLHGRAYMVGAGLYAWKS